MRGLSAGLGVARRSGLRQQLQLKCLGQQQSAPVCSVCLALSKAQQQQQLNNQQPLQLGKWVQRLRSPLIHPHDQGVYWAQRSYGHGGNRKVIDISKEWSYTGKYGVDNWAMYFGDAGGLQQSPVDLHQTMTSQDEKLTPFGFINFESTNNVSWFLQNTGHSAQVSFPTGDLRVHGGGLTSEYRVEQFHFHWGSDDSKGSEHTINGAPFPLEMHLVTYNSNYGNFTNALGYADGLAVLGVFYEVNAEDNPHYKDLVAALSKITEAYASSHPRPVPLRSMLPDDSDHFYRYQGSLTTPPCSEVVTWSLFEQAVPISSHQLAQFRKLTSMHKDSAGNPLPLVDNFRPIQPLNNRKIKCNL